MPKSPIYVSQVKHNDIGVVKECLSDNLAGIFTEVQFKISNEIEKK